MRKGLFPALLRSGGLSADKPAEQFFREAQHAVSALSGDDRDALAERLQRYKYRELVRIAARDLAGLAEPRQVGREATALAEGIVRAALSRLMSAAKSRGELPHGGFSVLGMGKLGGEDLNFSSDIDLVFFFSQEGLFSSGKSFAEGFGKLGQALSNVLSARTRHGFGYRVDLNLRPQGRSGPLVLSQAQMLQYYESFGRTWERAALLKARPIAGDLSLGQELLDELSPFVWRRSLDLRAVDELREMRAQIDLRAKASERDVKLGRGGIREVEFFVNALQLLHGGKDRALRERNTLRALRRLEHAGHVSSKTADALEEAYLFLRRVENRLQMIEERQTQQLPSEEADLERLARTMGFSSAAPFEAELSRQRELVAHAFHALLGETARHEVPDEPLLALALDLDAEVAQRQDALSQRGFLEPERALLLLDRLSRLRDSPFSAGPTGGSIAAVKLFAEIARTPDPDAALLHFTDFLTRLNAPQGYLELLGRHPQARVRLLNLFGQSDYLSRSFLRHPELLDLLVAPQLHDRQKPTERIRAEVSMRASRERDVEAKLPALSRYRNEEVLRIGLADISGDLDVPEVARQLSAIAFGVLDECLFAADGEIREKYGEPRSERTTESLAILGLGKLGGMELGYHSDLDLVFVYSGEGSGETTGGTRGKVTHGEYFAKVTQRLLSLLQMPLREGHLYKTDTRLRPSGNQGTLVVSEGAFLRHHRDRAQLWERQALIKARPVAGDLPFAQRLCTEIVEPLVYDRPLPENAGAEIARLRDRMERELSQESTEQLNVKTGHGGLVDVEFATQYLQLLYGGKERALRTPTTLTAISKLGECGALSPADAELLSQSYLFHRRVELRQRLVHGHSLAYLPTSGRALSQLARRLGYVGPTAGATFLEEYRSYTARIRDVYARALSRPSAPWPPPILPSP